MQTQRTSPNLCSPISAILQRRFILLVIFGSVLLLAVLALTFQLHLVEYVRATLHAAHQFVEGPPDKIATFIRTVL